MVKLSIRERKEMKDDGRKTRLRGWYHVARKRDEVKEWGVNVDWVDRKKWSNVGRASQGGRDGEGGERRIEEESGRGENTRRISSAPLLGFGPLSW